MWKWRLWCDEDTTSKSVYGGNQPPSMSSVTPYFHTIVAIAGRFFEDVFPKQRFKDSSGQNERSMQKNNWECSGSPDGEKVYNSTATRSLVWLQEKADSPGVTQPRVWTWIISLENRENGCIDALQFRHEARLSWNVAAKTKGKNVQRRGVCRIIPKKTAVTAKGLKKQSVKGLHTLSMLTKMFDSSFRWVRNITKGLNK